MNNDHITTADYIVLYKHGHGEYAPAVFSDGTLIIYNNKYEAIEDAGHDGIVAELVIPKN